jgi:hypothetical protein
VQENEQLYFYIIVLSTQRFCNLRSFHESHGKKTNYSWLSSISNLYQTNSSTSLEKKTYPLNMTNYQEWWLLCCTNHWRCANVPIGLIVLCCCWWNIPFCNYVFLSISICATWTEIITSEFQWKRGTFFQTMGKEKLLRKRAFAMLYHAFGKKRPP